MAFLFDKFPPGVLKYIDYYDVNSDLIVAIRKFIKINHVGISDI